MMKQPMFNFSQTYIEHGYIELTIPPANNYKMEPNHLHIWPRGEFMLIALPNQDRSWTVTLFMPLVKFDELLEGNANTIKSFFHKNFPDALQLIGESNLIEDFSKPFHLVSIKCTKYNVGNKAVILGDSAHAMVPFYGQGMNAGFEDCRILDEFIHNKGLDLEEALGLFSRTRSKNAEAICNLSMYNYSEMRQLVTEWSYIFRKKLDNILYWIFSSKWIPLYQSITFTNITYSECLQNRKRQNLILRNIFCVLLCGGFTSFSWYTFWWKQSR
ncbi:kynurenine 3-monooxygenase [Halyomorpha halys]|uniref:kynurenine 3-monooxygenase n=1 Tax=Halyomorpha halys TaxID=286706 RepID=UPI0034D17FC4